MKIVLISGHSKSKQGSSGEHEQNERVTNALLNYLKDNFSGVFLRDGDVASGTGEEAFIIKEKPDYFLSIHFNASNGSARGVECIIPTGEKVFSLETNILNDLKKLGFTSRGVKKRNNAGVFVNTNTVSGGTYYGILREPWEKGITGAIIEICFLDNKDDKKLYTENFDQIIKILGDNIAKSYKLPRKENQCNCCYCKSKRI